jgi:hypothetical protein
MTFRFASAVVVLFAVGMLAGACSSSSDSGTTGPGTCGGSSSGTGSAACGSCVQAHCSAQYNACFGSGGSCSAWTSGGCKGLPPDSCQTCILGDLKSCQDSNCSTECKSTTPTDSGTVTDTGGGESCAALAACCPSIDGDAGGPDGCNAVAKSGMDSTCASTLSAYQSAGYCK